MGKILVIGVGNSWRHDDGIGPHVIKILNQQFAAVIPRLDRGIQQSIDLLDGGIDGLALLDKISPYDYAIMIDAVNMGEVPGTIKAFTTKDAKLIVHDALSTHGFGVAELVILMKELGIETKIKIIGVQPVNIEFGEGLSPEVVAKTDQIITIIKEEVACVMQSQQN